MNKMSKVSPRTLVSVTLAPIFLILAFELYLFVKFSTHGLNLQDESFYLLNFVHWRNITSTVTLFGAYFGWIFNLTGQSIAAMRILTVVLLLISSGFLTREALLFVDYYNATGGARSKQDHQAHTIFVVASMAASLSYFVYLSTLRLPSYNLLSTITMAMATACLLRILRNAEKQKLIVALAFIYGIFLGACFFSKATSAVGLSVVHLIFFLIYARALPRTVFARLLLAAFVGFLINVIFIQISFPHWIDALRDGVWVLQERGGYSTKELIVDLWWDAERQLGAHATAVIACITAGMVAIFTLRSPRCIGIAACSASLVGALSLLSEPRPRLWWPAFVLVCVFLWTIRAVNKSALVQRASFSAGLPLTAMLILTPLVFSFGTNTYMLAHSAIASMFAFTAVFVCLYRLQQSNLIHQPWPVLCAILLCAPAAITQYRIVSDVDFTFKEAWSLKDNTVALPTGSKRENIEFDQNTAAVLREVQFVFSQHKWDPAEPVLGLVRDAPGIVYILGAKPVGSVWLVAGSKGADLSVENVLRQQGAAKLRSSWLLTSPDSKEGVTEWRAMLDRLDGFNHQLVAEVQMPYHGKVSVGSNKTTTLQIWKPRD